MASASLAVPGTVPLPLVKDVRSGTRRRLRGPPATLAASDLAESLQPMNCTLAEDGVVHFGESLLLLSHRTGVLLQADVSRELQVVDESHSARQAYQAFPLTTGKVMHPCGRTCFSLLRADHNDGFGDSFDVHYGQPVRLSPSTSSLSKHFALYLHLQEGGTCTGFTVNASVPVLLPRATARAVWRLMPLEPDSLPAPALGEVVRVNERVMLENMATREVLLTDISLLEETGFGTECRVFAEEVGTRELRLQEDPHEFEEEDTKLTDLGKAAAWSFVNDVWVDAVKKAEYVRTGGISWKEDEGDDFKKDEQVRRAAAEDVPALRPPAAEERKQREELYGRLDQGPGVDVCRRKILPAICEKGIHGPRMFKRMCMQADTRQDGSVAAHVLRGLTMSFRVRLSPQDLEDVCASFPGKSPQTLSYLDVLSFMEGAEGVMAEPRLEVVRRAYRRLLAVVGRDYLLIGELLSNWNPRSHPAVQEGDLDPSTAYQDFVNQWEITDPDGRVTPDEFLQYYREVSIVCPDTDRFIEMLRLAWDL